MSILFSLGCALRLTICFSLQNKGGALVERPEDRGALCRQPAEPEEGEAAGDAVGQDASGGLPLRQWLRQDLAPCRRTWGAGARCVRWVPACVSQPVLAVGRGCLTVCMCVCVCLLAASRTKGVGRRGSGSRVAHTSVQPLSSAVLRDADASSCHCS